MKTKILSLLAVLFLIIPHVSAQDRYEELDEYCNSHETILKEITETGFYGNISLHETTDDYGNTYLEIWARDAYPVPDYVIRNNANTSFLTRIHKKNVFSMGGGEKITPRIYMGSINDTLQILLIRKFRDADLRGENEIILLTDRRTPYQQLPGHYDSWLSLPIPSGYIQKIVPFGNHLLIKQETLGYRYIVYDRIYSLVSLIDSTLKVESYRKQVVINKK